MQIVNGSSTEWKTIPLVFHTEVPDYSSNKLLLHEKRIHYAMISYTLGHEDWLPDSAFSWMMDKERRDAYMIVDCSDEIKFASNIVVPNYVDGNPVLAVAGKTFKDIELKNFTCTSIVFSEGIKYLGSSLLQNFVEIKQLVLPESLIYIGQRTLSCLCEEVILPSHLLHIGGQCCAGNYRLKQCSLPVGMPQIPMYMFYGCENLSRVRIPGTVRYIGNNAFAWSGVDLVDIKEGVKEIGEKAFANCRRLSQIRIAKSVKKIAKDAFDPPSVNPNLTFRVFPESYGYMWARSYGYPIILEDK